MALSVHVVKRMILAGIRKGQEWFYGKVRLKGVLPFEKFCQWASEDTTLTPSDMESVLTSLSSVVSRNLEMGNIADLGDYGSMRLTAGSEGVDEKDKFKGNLMRKPRVVLCPGKLLKTMLSDVRYQWLNTIDEVVEVPCERKHFP